MNTGKQIIRKLAVAESFLLTLAMGAYFENRFVLRIHIVVLMCLTVIFLGMIYFIDQYKKNLLTLFVLTGILFAFIIITLALKVNFIKEIGKLYQWCLIYNGDEKLYERRYGVIVMAGILLLCGVVTYFLYHLKMVKNMAAAVLVVLLIISAVYKVNIPKITVGVIIFYSLSTLAVYCGKLYYKSSNTVNNSIATVYLAPACIIIALLSIWLPSGNEPIKWNGFKYFIEKAQEQGARLITQLEFLFDRNGNEFSVSFSGYSEELTELGGEVNVKNETALKVKTQNKSTAAGYLIGSISDTYTGRSWERSRRSRELEKEDYSYDFYELLIAFAREEGGDLTNFIKSRSYDIEYYDISTRSLFYPLKTYNIKFYRDLKFNETPQGAFLSDKAKGIGFKYNVKYYELNLNNKLLQKMLRERAEDSRSVSPEVLNRTAVKLFHYDMLPTDIDMEGLKQDLDRRSAEIKTWYTALPDSLPERVRILAAQLTKGCENDYDKLKAIEAYLNQLSYTTSIGKTPGGEDFVDYFLFHQKKGYCTYFASAFGVLGRCVGIPTRYIEGFMVDYKNIDSSGAYNVDSSSAHSWVEAYIEGIGWIPFEPTPAFYGARYTQWKEEPKTSGYSNFGESGFIQPSMPPAYQELINSGENFQLYQPQRKNYVLPFIGVVTSILILFIGITFIYYNILNVKYRKKFENASDNGKLFFIMAEILHYLEKEGFRMTDEDTLLTFAGRIGSKIKFSQTDFLKVAVIFMGVRYGEYEVKTQELKDVMEFSKDFRYYQEQRLGKRKMLLERFLFLHFYQ
ncbi:transglutaminase-like domain-containing protein [Anaerocolumna sp. AGMB13020]|uniref:transglutaminase-like domain-containing protein n=1 Tax=Anaerocolumna sp. AGMB13020 TaxID=3081750 RepID=UPI002952C86F|nr:transglutaminase-like domain-containing protein [Anaerocolumna sp. AGMB13020]WOO39033.1 transglutaminase-like domain-containing protein [Anaerocolumna sp. AGMB13020]